MYQLLALLSLVGIATASPVSPQGPLPSLHATPKGHTQTVSLVSNYQPRHVHLAYGEFTDEVVITWSTLDDTKDSQVEFGTNVFKLDQKVTNGTLDYFPNAPSGGPNVQYIHRVHLTNLEPGTTYYYHVGGIQGWSPVFAFKTFTTEQYPLSLAVFGDMGVVNARSLTRLQEEAHQSMYDAILHVGDFGYDMDDDNGVVGDTFMDQIEPIAAYLPYMTCPGNHEYVDDFHQYRNRFSMPNYRKTESIFHSFNIGPVHFVAVSTEVYYYLYQAERVQQQFEWLEADLKEAASQENRKVRPWIILFGHRPMYCSPNDDKDDCHFENTRTQTGLYVNGSLIGGMEELLVKYNVDLAFWAHEHAYQRTYPVYKYKTYKNTSDPYFNPMAPVHVLTGSAGCQEFIDPWQKVPSDEWSAVKVGSYGYTRLLFLNETTLRVQQVKDTDGSLWDEFHLVRETHEYPPLD